jgi:hypothetical protein
MPHEGREALMRVVGWIIAVAVLGVLAGFLAGLLRPRHMSDYHPTYDAPTPAAS